MDIVTKHDIEKFLKLLKAGLKDGKNKNLKIDSHSSIVGGTKYYVNLELSFSIDKEKINEIFADGDTDLSDQVDDLLKDI